MAKERIAFEWNELGNEDNEGISVSSAEGERFAEIADEITNSVKPDALRADVMAA